MHACGGVSTKSGEAGNRLRAQVESQSGVRGEDAKRRRKVMGRERVRACTVREYINSREEVEFSFQ